MRCETIKNINLITDYKNIPDDAYCQNEAVAILISWCGSFPVINLNQGAAFFWDDGPVHCQNCLDKIKWKNQVIYLDLI